MRDSHRTDAERLLARAVEEEVRRSGGRTDGQVLLTRSRTALDAMAQTAAEEYEAYTRALDEAAAGQLTFGQRYAQEGGELPAGGGRCRGSCGGGRPGPRHRYRHGVRRRGDRGSRGRGGDGGEGDRLPSARRTPPRRCRESARRSGAAAVAVADGAGGAGHPAVPGPAAGARRLHGSEEEAGAAAARHGQERGGAPTECTGAVLRSTPGAGRSVRRSTDGAGPDPAVGAGGPGEYGDPADGGRPARRARLGAHHPRGPCRARSSGPVPRCLCGGSTRRQRGRAPLPTRDALLHLLNRLGAPREQLLFRERSSPTNRSSGSASCTTST